MRSNHFICPITKALQTELKPSLIWPIYFNLSPPFMKIFPFLQTYLKIFSYKFALFIFTLYSQIVFTWSSQTYISWNKERWNHFMCPITKLLQTELKTTTDIANTFWLFLRTFLIQYCFQYIYICIISKVGIVCPNSFHLTYVSWNKERSNHFICPITKALQTELKPSLILPIYFD